MIDNEIVNNRRHQEKGSQKSAVKLLFKKIIPSTLPTALINDLKLRKVSFFAHLLDYLDKKL